MSKTIDERVVEMRFENDQFESGIRQSTQSLEMLRKSLRLDEATDSLRNIENAANGMNFSTLNANVEDIGTHFSTMGVFVDQVIRNMANSVYSTITGVIGKLKSKIITGGFTRALNIEQAKFQLQGLGVAWKDVAGSIDYAVKGTRYGLDAAAKAAAQLSASNVQLGDDMSTSLRAISGVAAMTNQEYDRTAQIFTTIAGNGKVMTQQLRQFSVDGLNAAATLGKALGKTEEQIYDMVSKGQIDFKTFAKAMDDAFGEHAKKANETFSGALANMGAALGRVGADFFTPFLPAARDVMNAFTGVIDKFRSAIQPITNALGEAMSTISGRISYFLDSVDMTGFANRIASGIGVLRNALFAGDTEITNFERAWSGLKATFSIIGQLIAAVARALGTLLTALAPLGHAIMTVAANIGDFMVALDSALKSSGALDVIFSGIASVVGAVVNVLAKAADAVAQFFAAFNVFDFSRLKELGSDVESSLSPMAVVLDHFKSIFASIGDALSSLNPLFDKFGEVILKAFSALGEALGNGDLSSVLHALNAFLTTITIANFMDIGKGIEYLGKIFERNIAPITASFKTLRATLAAYNMSLSAKGLKDLGIGLLAVAAALLVISRIPEDRLVSSFTALAGALGALVGGIKLATMAIQSTGFFKLMALSGVVLTFSISLGILSASLVALSKIDIASMGTALLGLGGAMAILVAGINLLGKSSIKVAVTAASLVVLALALSIMGANLKMLSGLQLDEIGRGLLALGGSMAILAVGARVIGGTSLKLAATAAGILLLATSLVVLSVALQRLSALQLDEIGRGLLALGGIMAELAVFTKLVSKGGPNMIAMGAGLLLVASSMMIFAKAMRRMANLQLDQIGRSMLAMGGALAEVGVAMRIMPKDTAVKAVGLLVVAKALTTLTSVLKSMGGMSWGEIGHSLVELGGAIAILAVGLRAMQGAIGGAAALTVAALGISMLSASLALLAAIPLLALITGLGAMAAALGILIGAAYLAAPVIPIIIALAAAMALLGVGMGGLAAVIFGAVAAVQLLASISQPALDNISNAITALVSNLSTIAQAMATALADFIVVIGENADRIADAFGKLLSEILRVIREKSPEIISTFLGLIDELLRKLSTKIPDFVNYGIDMVINLLRGINQRMPDLIHEGAQLVISVMDGLGKEAPNLIDSGVTMIINFINGLAETIRTRSEEVGEAAANLGIAIVEGVIRGLAGFGRRIGEYLSQKAREAMDNVKAKLGINSPSKVFRDEVGKPIADGIAVGIEKNESVGKAAIGMAKGLLKTTKNALKIHSPSVVFKEEVGRWIAEGITEGIKADATAEEAMEQKAQNIVNAFKKELDRADLRSDIANLQFELWKAMNPNATEAEQQEKNIEMLDLRLEQQQKKINFLKDELQQTIEEFGEASDQAMEAQKEYLQAQKDYYDTVNELNSLKGTATAANENLDEIIAAQRNAMHEAEKMMQELMEINKKMNFGWSMDEMRKVAAERTGYDEKVLRQAMGLPTAEQTQEVVESTAEDLNESVQTEFGDKVGESFTNTGEQYAQNIGDAFVMSMSEQKKLMVASVVDAQKAVETQLSKKSSMTPVTSSGSSVYIGSNVPVRVVAGESLRTVDKNVSASKQDASADSRSKSMTITNNYNMTQNNTSPEALSEAKIYRQTSNLFSSLKNANGYNKVVATA